MCAGLKWQWAISCCCNDLSRQAGQRQTRLQFLRTVWDGRGVCSHEVSSTTGCVCRRAGLGLSGDHRQVGAARSPGSCNPLCRFLGRLCVVLGGFCRLSSAASWQSGGISQRVLPRFSLEDHVYAQSPSSLLGT